MLKGDFGQFHELTSCMLSTLGVKPPLANKLQMTDVYDPKTNKPRPDVLKQHFFGEGRLKPDVAMRIIADGALLFRQEKCLLDLPQPLTGSDYTTHVYLIFVPTLLENKCVLAYLLQRAMSTD